MNSEKMERRDRNATRDADLGSRDEDAIQEKG